MSYKELTPEEAAALIEHGENIGFSGFTAAGVPKAVPRAIAARGILQSGETPLSALRGTFHTAFDTPVRVTYNPSYLLRTEDISEKRKVWEDMLCVMERAGLPISDKQRSYFLPRK